MKTESAPTTALSGRNKSDDSLTVSMAILADSLDDPGSLGAMSLGLQNTEVGNAVALDEAARVLWSLGSARG